MSTLMGHTTLVQLILIYISQATSSEVLQSEFHIRFPISTCAFLSCLYIHLITETLSGVVEFMKLLYYAFFSILLVSQSMFLIHRTIIYTLHYCIAFTADTDFRIRGSASCT